MEKGHLRSVRERFNRLPVWWFHVMPCQVLELDWGCARLSVLYVACVVSHHQGLPGWGKQVRVRSGSWSSFRYKAR